MYLWLFVSSSNFQYSLYFQTLSLIRMGRKRQAEVTSPEQRPPAPVDDHDGQHDANEDGDKNDDEEQDVYLVRSVVHDEFAQTS